MPKDFELYKVARPAALGDMVGSGGQVAGTIQAMLAAGTFPRASLFTGPSGCGKTTLARIVQAELDCGKLDFTEMNCANFNGVDMVRDLQSQMYQAPMTGPCRVWLIDEAHQLTSAAQNAFLKALEDTPQHVYFMLATTNPEKLIKTIRTRCTLFAVQSYTDKELQKIIKKALVAAGNKKRLPKDVMEAIVDNADGSARQALVLVDHALAAGENALEVITNIKPSPQAFELAKMLFAGKPVWSKACKLFPDLVGDPESARRIILAYAATILAKTSGKRADSAYDIIRAFESPFYDSGKAGLVAACYAVIVGEPVDDGE